MHVAKHLASPAEAHLDLVVHHQCPVVRRPLPERLRVLFRNAEYRGTLYTFQDHACNIFWLDALVLQATDNGTDFDWFDAAVLSFKLTQSLINQADELLYSDMPDAMRSFQEELD